MPSGREGNRCRIRQEQVAGYSRALVVTAATATTLRAALLLRRILAAPEYLLCLIFRGVNATFHRLW